MILMFNCNQDKSVNVNLYSNSLGEFDQETKDILNDAIEQMPVQSHEFKVGVLGENRTTSQCEVVYYIDNFHLKYQFIKAGKKWTRSERIKDPNEINRLKKINNDCSYKLGTLYFPSPLPSPWHGYDFVDEWSDWGDYIVGNGYNCGQGPGSGQCYTGSIRCGKARFTYSFLNNNWLSKRTCSPTFSFYVGGTFVSLMSYANTPTQRSVSAKFSHFRIF